MSVEKALKILEDYITVTAAVGAGNSFAVHDATQALAEVRSEQVAHVANCHCCLVYKPLMRPMGEGCVFCGRDKSEHPYTDLCCKPLDLHDAEVRLEALEFAFSDCEGGPRDSFRRLEFQMKQARAAVDKLKGRK